MMPFLTKTVELPKSTVQNIVSRIKLTGSPLYGKRPGAPKKIDERAERHMEVTVKNNPSATYDDLRLDLKGAVLFIRSLSSLINYFVEGDTIPAVCSKVGYQCKIDMRVTVSHKDCVDLSVVEYAKITSYNKYYKDKVKAVLSSTIYFRNYQKNDSNVKFVSSMLIARLEGELLLYYKADRNWFAVDKIADVDVPQSIDHIKEGGINTFVNPLKNHLFMAISCMFIQSIIMVIHNCHIIRPGYSIGDTLSAAPLLYLGNHY
ncbi:hypothetical protein BDF21DRAFT_450181 [Thamnidium elegans]|nr:hypothetical protein BDF21DRAFT_450181 [Thamnidium elegans]